MVYGCRFSFNHHCLILEKALYNLTISLLWILFKYQQIIACCVLVLFSEASVSFDEFWNWCHASLISTISFWRVEENVFLMSPILNVGFLLFGSLSLDLPFVLVMKRVTDCADWCWFL